MGFLILIVLIFLVLVILVLELTLHVVTELLELKGFTGEPVDGTGNELLLDVFTELVVELKALLDIAGDGIVVIGGGLWGREEVEEGFGGHADLDNAGLLGAWG